MTAPDGNLWFTEDGALGRITRVGQLTQFTAGGLGLVAGGQIAVSSDGYVWFGANHGLWRSTLSGTATEFTPNLITGGVAPASGGSMWFTYAGTTGGSSGISRISPTGAVTPVSDTPNACCLLDGPGGNVWFITDDITTHGVGVITPAGKVRTFTRGFGGEQITSRTMSPESSRTSPRVQTAICGRPTWGVRSIA
ncbi:MAG: hypothetical protein M3065_16090 [Actinomycetota bacterium]|nr:hypothetical protein [Actinomycetota bacterium]